MEFLKSINTLIERRAHQYTAYITTLYYFEVVYLMLGILFLYGKTASILCGSTLSLVLAYHIIRIFFKNGLHRKIQLYLIDVHAAFVIGYLFSSSAAGIDAGGIMVILYIIRSITLFLELPLIFFLTRSTIAGQFT
ncbi:MAG: hypothetical protein A2W19_05860 [Spirochaetes bacterium RBG_16_49_21]|nr:MAG: hypothetical protein A2W19_05860 [Spirochaetes bacterium RBG_16_49_21]